MDDFLDGARLLLRGWGFWRRSPSTMLLGLVPAMLAATLVVVVLAVLALNLGRIGDVLTGFADEWSPTSQQVAEFTVQALVLAAVVVLVVVSFTGLTLAIGEPFYDRIWRAVERGETGSVPSGDTGFWRGAVDGLTLVARGLVVAVVVGLLGLLPGVGTVAGWVTGVLLTGWVLAHELTTRALVARGIDRRDRNHLLRAHRWRAVGFGAATQLCFLVPGGAVATMPAAVAGSTLLAHDLLRRGVPAAGAAPVVPSPALAGPSGPPQSRK